MTDTCLVEPGPLGREAAGRIEAERIGLRVQVDAAKAPRPRELDEPAEQEAAYAVATKRRQHRKPADLTGGQQPSRADWFTLRKGEDVNGARIGAVPLERLGNALFGAEHRAPDRRERGAFAGPVADHEFDRR